MSTIPLEISPEHIRKNIEGYVLWKLMEAEKNCVLQYFLEVFELT